MSQRGPVSRAVSHRSSSGSPPRDSRASPSDSELRGVQIRDDMRTELARESEGVRSTRDGERLQQITPRTSGVHDILNPPGPHYGSGAPPSAVQRAGGETEQVPSSVDGGRYGGTSPHQFFGYHSQAPSPLSQPEPGLPPPRLLPGPSPQLERGSPTSVHPFPALGAPRRILTPKSPMPGGLGRGSPYRPTESPSPFGPSRGGPPPSDLSYGPGPSHGALVQFTAGPSPTGIPSTLVPLVTPPRSLSQPLLGHVHHPGYSTDPTQAPGFGGRDFQGRTSFGPGTVFHPGPGPSRGLPTPGLGDGQWLPMAGVHSGNRVLSVSEGPQYLTIHPDVGETIHVPVDMHQASRHSDEKRQRNAGASARFRARKKERERDVQNGIQRLEAQNRELHDEMRGLRIQRDYYRNERNRLRDIVKRTPSIRDLADQCPPSPSSRSTGSFAAENSPMPTPSHPQPAHVRDASPHGRPARRRRIDPAPEFSGPSYGPLPPSSMPPMPQHNYGVAPTALPPVNPRLPPLRTDQPGGFPPTEQAPPASRGPSPGTSQQHPPSSARQRTVRDRMAGRNERAA